MRSWALGRVEPAIRMRRLPAPAFAILVCAIAFLAVPGAAGMQYLSNGGFERGGDPKRADTPFDWYRNAGAGLGGHEQIVKDRAAAHSGECCIQLTSDEPGKEEMALMTERFPIACDAYQVEVAVKGEGRFVVYLYQYAPANEGGAFLVSVPFGGEATSQWTEHRWSYTPQANVGAVAFALHARGKVCFDDCSFKGLSDGVSKAAAEGSAAAEHFWTIPRLTQAPRIDGVLDPDEWAGAAATTGFVTNERMVASRLQPLVYGGYDEACLYFCFLSRLDATRSVVATVRDRDGNVWSDDNVEILLQPAPPGGTFFHFSAGAAGGFADMRDEDAAYDSNSVYRTSVQNGTWVAEFAIPFADLGATADKGALWGVNFTRGTVAPTQWTSWAPALSFADARTFGRMRLGGRAPAARIDSMGNLLTGRVRLAGSILAEGGAFQFAAGAGARGEEIPKEIDAANIHDVGRMPQTIEMVRQKVTVADGAAPLLFEKTVEAKHCRVIWELAAADGSAVLQRHFVDFDPVEPLVMQVIPSPARGFIEVRCDAVGSSQEGVPLTGTVTLRRQGLEPPIESQPILFDGAVGTARLSLESVTPGDHTATAVVSAGEGTNVEARAGFTRPDPIPESYSNAGHEPEVPAPWTPVEVDGHAVKVWNRQLCFGANGLPSQVRSAGLDLLAGPITLRAYGRGDEIAGVSPPGPAVSVVSPGAAEAAGESIFGGLSVHTKSRTEFDGCIRVDLEIRIEQGRLPDALVLCIPMQPAVAQLGHWHSMVWDAYSGAIPAGTGVVWSSAFKPFVWIGDTHAGLCWFAGSQEGWRTSPEKPAQEIVRSEGATILRVNLAARPFAPGQVHRITFGLQPTPVRPRPADWRRLRLGRANPYIPEDQAYDRYILEMGEQYPNYPCPKDDALTARIRDGVAKGELPKDFFCLSRAEVMALRDKVHAAGGRIVWYTQVNGIATETPWNSFYGADWRMTYGMPGRSARGAWWWTDPVCPADPVWQDFLVGTFAESLATYDFDGAYIDLFSCRRCDNPVHGCGYVDDTGRRRPERPVWATRDLMKRLYRVVHTRPNGVIIAHISCSYMPFIHGFADVALVGEHYWTHFHVQGGMDYHDVLPLDKCRTEVSMRQWGWVPFWLPEFRRTSVETTRQMLSLILLHDMLVLPARIVDEPYYQANAVLYRLGFVGAEFVEYDDVPAPGRTSDNDVLVSAYRNLPGQPGSAILIISNCGEAGGTFEVEPNAQALGLTSGAWLAAEHGTVEKETPLPTTQRKFMIEIPGKDFRIVSIRNSP